MTLKHIKFEDSVVMRSLERVAKEKGLVKDPEINKTASAKKLDLSLSNNLMDNVLKLCAGLRASGFDKYANELEINFLSYKQATQRTLYETSSETGEDVVNFAHPQGSHKLENVNSDESVIETILDKHLKIVNVVNKMPSGKLASAQDVINAVKMSLGQSSKAELDAVIDKEANHTKDLWNVIDQEVSSGMGPWWQYGIYGIWSKSYDFGTYSKWINESLTLRPLTLARLQRLSEDLSAMSTVVQKYKGGDLWPRIKPTVLEMQKSISKMEAWNKQINELGEKSMPGDSVPTPASSETGVHVIPEVTMEASVFEAKTDRQVEDLELWQGQLEMTDLTPSEKATASSWISKQLKEFEKIKGLWAKVPEHRKSEFKNKFDAKLQTLINENQQFYKEWMQ